MRRKTARYFSKLSETGPGDGTAKRRKIEETLEGADDGEDNAFEDAFRLSTSVLGLVLMPDGLDASRALQRPQ